VASSSVDWIAVEGAYRAGTKSLRDIAAEYGTASSTIKSRAKKHGWIQDASGTKRRIVADRMAGIAHQVAQNAMCEIESAATHDVEDMLQGLGVARVCLRRLTAIAEQSEDAKEIKTIAEANKIAVETIRRIRGLDDVQDGVVHVSWAGA
jgi:uncharacterized protein YjcR